MCSSSQPKKASSNMKYEWSHSLYTCLITAWSAYSFYASLNIWAGNGTILPQQFSGTISSVDTTIAL